MAKNCIQPATRVTELTLSSDRSSGAIVRAGQIIGVALVSGVNGQKVNCALDGIWQVPKVNNLGFTQGQQLYYNPAADKLTSATSTSFVYAGVASEATATTATDGPLVLGYPKKA